MITRITKENRAKYVRLFAKATEALKASNSASYPADFSISSLEEDFQNIEPLFEVSPQYARLPLDEETFDIDLKLTDYLEVDEDLTILDKLHINYLVLDDLEIINIKSYKDNNYDKYCLGLVINKVVKKIGNKLIKYY